MQTKELTTYSYEPQYIHPEKEEIKSGRELRRERRKLERKKIIYKSGGGIGRRMQQAV